MKVEVSRTIERPVAEVFSFFADNHVQNHPRWDPDMELEQVSVGPVEVGTMIRRRNRHSGELVEGTMEVVEFERDKKFSTLIHEGPMEYRGGAIFEALDEYQTKLTISVELPGDPVDPAVLEPLMDRSTRNIKHLIETGS